MSTSTTAAPHVPGAAVGTPDRRPTGAAPLVALAVAATGWGGAWVLLRLLDLSDVAVGPEGVGPVATGVVVVVLGMLATSVAGTRAGLGTPGTLVAAASTLLAGVGTVALHGTRWGFDGLYSDAGFRTEAVTRFASSASLSDYAYRGLPSYYPPLLPWLQGRVAWALDVPGWTVMKPTQLLVCLLVPVLSWALWRRVLGDARGAWVAVAVAVAVALGPKPDEWLVLTLVVPWWLDAVRGIRQSAAPRWGPLRQGVLLGLLLMSHTYFFLPLALATLAGLALDVVRRRPWPLSVPDGLRTAATGVLLAGPTWLPTALLRLGGPPADHLQLRWSPRGFTWPPVPVPVDVPGFLALVAVVWLVVRLRARSRLVVELCALLGTAYALVVVGQWAQTWGVAVLPEKSVELCLALLATCSALAAADVSRVVVSRTGWDARRHLLAPWGLVLALALGATTVVTWELGQVGPSGRAAAQMRYPDGSFPVHGPGSAYSHWHPWGVDPAGTGSSVAEVQDAWEQMTGRPLGDQDTLVSARADVLATTPAHAFVTWKSIYSHPHGQFADRVRLLEDASACPTARCAWTALRSTPWGPVDGLVLSRHGDRLSLSVTLDDFPEAWRVLRLDFDASVLDAPYFLRLDVGTTTVVHVVPPPDGTAR